MVAHEKIIYKQNLPFSANFINVRDEPVHCHKEIEILLLLRGFSRYKIYHMDYALQPGDMIIADVEDLHRIHDSSEDVLMLQLHLDTKKFEEIHPNISSTYFVCENPGTFQGQGSNGNLKEKQQLLKHLLAKLVMDNLGSPNDFVLHTDNINDVIATLIRHFRGFYMEDYQYRVGRDNVSETDLDRMSRITSYLLNHFDEKVTLQDVSITEHLNPYYVSHLIKKTLGISFQSFVNGIRLEFAEKYLLFTTQTLTQIAENCGFSSLNYFNKCFQDWYGTTPSQYRKYIPNTDRLTGLPFSSAEALDLIGKFLTPVISIKKLALAPSFAANQWELVSSEVPAAFRPIIQLNTPEDLMGLGFLRDRILAIRPISFRVDSRVLSPGAYGALQTFDVPIEVMEFEALPNTVSSVQNTASALAQITGQTSGDFAIPLFGDTNALFLQEGLAAPHYTGYQILSGLSGNRLLVSHQVLMSRSEKELSVVLYNPDPGAILNIRLDTKNLPEKFVLIKKQIPEENNCYTILEALGHPALIPAEVIREIDQSHLGVPQFQMVERGVSPMLDFMVYPQHVTLLIFSPLTSQ